MQSAVCCLRSLSCAAPLLALYLPSCPLLPGCLCSQPLPLILLPWYLLCSPPQSSTLTPTLPHLLLILLFIFTWCPCLPLPFLSRHVPSSGSFNPQVSTIWSLMLREQNVSRAGGPLFNEQSNTHTQLGFLKGRKQQYYVVKTDGRHFSLSSQLPDPTSGPRELPEGKMCVCACLCIREMCELSMCMCRG